MYISLKISTLIFADFILRISQSVVDSWLPKRHEIFEQENAEAV